MPGRAGLNIARQFDVKVPLPPAVAVARERLLAKQVDGLDTLSLRFRTGAEIPGPISVGGGQYHLVRKGGFV